MEIASDVDTLIYSPETVTLTCYWTGSRRKYGVSTEVYGVPALTANSLVDAAGIYHPIEEDLLL